LLGLSLGWKRAEKGEGKEEEVDEEEEGGLAVRTSIGRSVLRETTCVVMGIGEAAVRAMVVEEEEDMDNCWLRRGSGLGAGDWRRKASAVMGQREQRRMRGRRRTRLLRGEGLEEG